MKLQKAQKVAAAVACLAMLFSPTAMAAPAVALSPDVSLHDGGVLLGQVVDSQGLAIAQSPVVVLSRGKEVARTQTDKTGKFAVKGLNGGVYEVATAQQRGVYRLWSPRTAPPVARQGILITSSRNVVRAQGGNPFQTVGEFVTKHPIMSAGIVATAIAIPLALASP